MHFHSFMYRKKKKEKGEGQETWVARSKGNKKNPIDVLILIHLLHN